MSSSIKISLYYLCCPSSSQIKVSPVLTGNSLDGRAEAGCFTGSEAFAAHGRVRTLVLDVLEVGVELAGLRRRNADLLERVDT